MYFFCYDKVYNWLISSNFTMVNEIIGGDIIDYLNNLEKKGYNRELIEEVATKFGGDYVYVNESEKRNSVLNHLGLTLVGAGIAGLATYLTTDFILDDFQRVGRDTAVATGGGAFVMFETYRSLVEYASDKAKKGVRNYLRKDL